MALEATPEYGHHLPEETLEKYAFGRLPADELETVEAHLLVCEYCRERLDTEDDFAEAMHVLGKLSLQDEMSTGLDRGKSLAARAIGRLTHSSADLGAVALIVALVPVLLGGIALWMLPRGLHRPGDENPRVEMVALNALRAGEQALTQADAGHALDLSIDVHTISDLRPGAGFYRLELVDTDGDAVWTGTASQVSEGKMGARMSRHLAAGIYWVRLYAPSGKLLREYGLEAK